MKPCLCGCLFLASLASCSGETSSTSVAQAELLDPPSRDGWNPDAAWPGFTLIAPLKSVHVQLVDMAGEAVHSWEAPRKPGVASYLTERGTLLHCLRIEDHPVFEGGGQGGWIQELDLDGSVLWDFHWDSDQGISHHDIEELPNGNILMIAWDRIARAEALAAGRDPELLAGDEFWPGAVYEIEPTRPEGGKVVWSWHAWDHRIQNLDPEKPNHGNPAEHPERIDINGDRDPEPSAEEEAEVAAEMAALGYTGDDDEEEDPEKAAFNARIEGADWLHMNAIDYNAELDQIVLSARRFDEVWIIDHSTTTAEAAGSQGGRHGKGGDLLYRWGNPFAYGMGRWEERQLLGQHHVQWVPEGSLGAGSLIVFNNGARPREHSSVDEWWPPRDAEGNYVREKNQPFGPAEPDWSHAAPDPADFYSSFISGVQRLANGNTLICSGTQGWVFEVTRRTTLESLRCAPRERRSPSTRAPVRPRTSTWSPQGRSRN